MKTSWKQNARLVRTIYGAYVDWEERFYICPHCEEPIYQCDFPIQEKACPVCEEEFEE